MSAELLMWLGGIAATGIFGLIGWAFTMTHARIDKIIDNHDALETRFDAHRLYAAETFTTKKDVKDAKDEIIDVINRLEDKIERRVGVRKPKDEN